MLRSVRRPGADSGEAELRLRTLEEFPRVLYGKYFIEEVEDIKAEWQNKYEDAIICDSDIKKDFRFIKGVIFGLKLALSIPVVAAQMLGLLTVDRSNKIREHEKRVDKNSESDNQHNSEVTV